MELAVTILILGVVLAIVLTALISVQHAVNSADYRSQTAAQARLGEQQLVSQIRSGNYLYDPAGEYGSGSPPTTSNAGPVCASSASVNCVPYSGTGGFSLRVFTQTAGVYQCVQWRELRQTAGQAALQFRSWSPTWRSDGKVTAWLTVASDLVNPTTSPPFVLDSNSQYGGRLIDIDLISNALPKAAGGTIVANVTEQATATGRNVEFGYDSAVCSTIPSP